MNKGLVYQTFLTGGHPSDNIDLCISATRESNFMKCFTPTWLTKGKTQWQCQVLVRFKEINFLHTRVAV